MSNSPLVSYTKISPNKTKRAYRNSSSTGKISKITIHHMAGCISVESCGSWFAQSSAKCSSNYGIDSTGKIALYVPEDYRSWCSSNGDNDNIAVTIEIANSSSGGNWPVSDKALAACIDLCVDICQRNGIAQLNYTGTKAGNLTRHDMFCNKVCPGPYLGSRFPYIADQVNKRLGKPLEITADSVKPTIQYGDNNAYVSKCQELLMKLGYNLNVSAPTGYFGTNTLAAVKKFQTEKNLYVDGVVGSQTWPVLFKAVEKDKEVPFEVDELPLVLDGEPETESTKEVLQTVSKCTSGQAVAAMEYWLGYYEKASSSYATTRDKSAFEANKGSNNYTYAGYLCGVQGQPWCAAQVSLAIYEACGNDKTLAKEVIHGVWPYVSCNQVWDAAPDNMRYWSHYQRWTLGKGVRQTYKPIAGDIIVFTDDKTTRSHTGMVYSCDGTYVYTIEGNSGNMCRKRSYLLTSSYIYGWIRPKYATAAVAPVETTPTKVEQYGEEIGVALHKLSKGCAGKEVESLQKLVGTTVDGDFGKVTEAAVIKFQADNKLEETGVVDAATWDKLIGG